MNFDKIINVSKKCEMKHKYIAVLIYKNKIISIGYNKLKPVKSKKDNYILNKYSIHAELNCINNCKNKKIIKDSKMILFRISKGQFIKCECCNICKKIIEKYNIKKVVYYY